MGRQPLRNLGILAHIDAGKTTLTENLLHLTGAIRYPGAVEHGSTATDWLLQEQQRGITIGAAAITCVWRETAITIVDTPGHVDFTIEVERSLRVLDGVVLVISGPDGVEAQTETVWHQASRRELPAVVFVNKLDREGFDDVAVLEQIRDRLGVEPAPLWVARRTTRGLTLLSVIEGVAVDYSLEGLTRHQRASPSPRAPDEEEDLAIQIAREQLVDAIASSDDEFAAAVLAGQEPPPAAYVEAVRRATLARACVPVLYGVARFGIGVDALADAVVDLLPAPNEARVPAVYDLVSGEPRREAFAELEGDAVAAFVFKTEKRPRGEKLAYVRVFAGALTAGEALVRLPGQGTMVPRRIVRIMGGDDEPVSRLDVGMIGGIEVEAGPDQPQTGETLARGGLPYSFEPLTPPEPVLSVTLEAPDLASHDVMLTGLYDVAADDPSLVVGADPSTGLAMLSGMGELHLALAIERLERETKVRVRTGYPAARLREVVLGRGRGEATHVTPHGRGRVRVRAEVKPAATHLGVPTRYDTPLPRRRDWREALEAGVASGLGTDGTRTPSVVETEIEILELEVHGSDIAPVVFRDAARDAVSAALIAAGLATAEPWVSLHVVVPESLVGSVVGDLARRRARITGSLSRGQSQVLQVIAPLAELIGYATELRSLTGGRGVFTMEPKGYEAVADA